MSHVDYGQRKGTLTCLFLKPGYADCREHYQHRRNSYYEDKLCACAMAHRGRQRVNWVHSCLGMMDCGRSAGHSFHSKLINRGDHLFAVLQGRGSRGARIRRLPRARTSAPDGEGGRLVAFKLREASALVEHRRTHGCGMSRSTMPRHIGRAITAIESAAISKAASAASRAANALRVDWDARQVRRSDRSDRKPEPISIASTGDSLASPQFAKTRHCKTAK